MEDIINIRQELIKTGDASYSVEITIHRNDGTETLEFNYDDTNAIFPMYNSLINTIKDKEDVHIELETSDKRFANEIMGSPNVNARMLEILKNIQERQNITIDAF